MAETHYGPWSNRLPMDPPDGSLWECLLFVYTDGDFVQTYAAMSGSVQIPSFLTFKECRRIYPPGSVLPEPRQTATAKLAAIDWPCWAVHKHGHYWATFWRGEILLDYHPKELITVYPVQQLDNGAWVAVPWSAVEST